MKESIYKNYEDLPLFLTPQMVSDLLGISLSKSYALMKDNNFPSLRVGSRIVVPREKFRKWVDESTGGTV